jgi:hypothetical protein
MIINARPHINGNSEADFIIAAVAFDRVFNAITEAMSKVRTNVTHGRNYQHLDAETASFRRNDDIEAIKAKVDAASEALAAVMDAVMDSRAFDQAA